jgi:hypothetical protein
VKIAFLNDVEIQNEKAEIVTQCLTSELQSRLMPLTKMSCLASDGDSTFSGARTGVTKPLGDAGNGSMIFHHCKDHRLALACSDSFKVMKVIQDVDQLLNNLHKYCKYSTVNNARLRKVQEIIKEPQLTLKQAKHHRWLSHNQAVSALVRSYR